jgi:hypothetical protein
MSKKRTYFPAGPSPESLIKKYSNGTLFLCLLMK